MVRLPAALQHADWRSAARSLEGNRVTRCLMVSVKLLTALAHFLRGLFAPHSASPSMANGGVAPSIQSNPVPLTRNASTEPAAPERHSKSSLQVAQNKAFDHGYKGAGNSLHHDEEHLKLLVESAIKGIALPLLRNAKQVNSLDKDIEKAHSDMRTRLPKLQHMLEIAEGNVRHHRENRERLGELGPFPAASATFTTLASCFFALSIAPAIHDILGTLFPALRWLLAIGASLATGRFIVMGILPDEKQSEPDRDDAERQKSAAYLGILTGLAFLVVRLGLMDFTLANVAITAGGALIEVVVVLFTERKAAELNPQIATYWLRAREIREADGLLRAALEHRDYCLDLVEALQRDIARKSQERDENQAFGDKQMLFDLIEGQTRMGYQKAINDNQGGAWGARAGGGNDGHGGVSGGGNITPINERKPAA